jgi:hypothetical protein
VLTESCSKKGVFSSSRKFISYQSGTVVKAVFWPTSVALTMEGMEYVAVARKSLSLAERDESWEGS